MRRQGRVFAKGLLAILLAVWLAPVKQTFALDPGKRFSQYVQSSWALQNGLPQKTVMAIAQTGDGFLWLATEEGLIRFSGRSFVTFDERNAPGLGDRFIRSLATGPDGSLWIGTMSGLAHYKDGKFKSYRNEAESRIDIYDICVGIDGSVWFSSDQGLRRVLNGTLRNYTTADGLPTNGITGVAAAPDGTVWIATLKGLVRFQAERFTIYDKWIGSAGGVLNTVSIGRNGSVWIGARNGNVGRWKDGNITTWWNGRGTHNARIENLHEDRDGNLWIAFENLGLGRMRGHNLELSTRRDGLPSNNPDWLYEDREQNLWVGWADAGLSMLRDAKFTMFGKPEGLSSDSISSVIQAIDGSLWVGTADAGLDRLQGTSVHNYSTREGLTSEKVLGLLQERNGAFWVGSGSGSVTKIEGARSTTFEIKGGLSPELPAIVQAPSGDLWFGFDMPNGLARLRNGKFEQLPLEGRVKGLAIAPNGALWIASYLHGLSAFQNGTFRTYTVKDGLSSPFLTSVYADPTGSVWAGTALAGLNRWKDGKITRYSVEQGLADSTVGAIIEDNVGYLWLSGPRGISRVSLKDMDDYSEGLIQKVHTESFGYADGLRSAECSALAQPAIFKARNGELWFATTAGLAMIDPAHIRTNNIAPTVQISGLSLNSKAALEIVNGMQLGPGGGQVDINFAAPSFVAPEQMHVRYRLVEVDRDWVEVGSRRSVTYSNLGPGKYRFEVWAANNDGLRTKDLTTFDFRILPHYYQTYWFRALCVLCAVLLAWRIYASRVQYLVRKTQELEATVLRRTSEVRAALLTAEAAKEQLREQAMRDSLTGFWNRRAIFEILLGEITRCSKEDEPLCILMADIDYFKKVNDTWGHLAGDVVLQDISDCLRRGLRRHEAIGKYGGEEFLVLLPSCSFETAFKRAEDLRCAIEDHTVKINGRDIAVTCSFGIAQFESSCSLEELIGHADAALYSAKSQGRNCVWPRPSSDSAVSLLPLTKSEGLT